MECDSYKDWVSLYSDEMNLIWKTQRKELRNVAMIYYVLDKELDRIKQDAVNFFERIKLQQTINEGVEGNISALPLKEKDLNEIQVKHSSLSFPNNKVKQSSPVKSASKKIHKSPVLIKKKPKQSENTEISNLYPTKSNKFEKVLNEQKSNIEERNFMDTSIIEKTPELVPAKKLKTLLFNKTKSKNKSQSNNLFREEKTKKKNKRKIEDNQASMDIEEMINYINQSSETSGDEAESSSNSNCDTICETELCFKENYNKITETKIKSKTPYIEEFKGSKREMLKGWSCEECAIFYQKLNLPPEELKIKMDECSKHRGNVDPKSGITFNGFWDLTFAETQESQDTEKSLIFNFKK